MLLAGLPSALGVPEAERGPLQKQVVSWIEDTLAAVRRRAEAEKAAAEEALSGVEGEKATRDEALAAAKAAQTACNEALGEKKQVAKDAAAAVKAAGVAVADAGRTLKAADDELGALDAKRQKLASIMEAFVQLREPAEGAPPAAAAQVKLVTKAGEELGFDRSMLQALPSAFVKKPEERGVFDKMVFEQFEEEHQKSSASLEGALAEGAAAKESRTLAADAAKSALDAAAAAEGKAKEELKEATEGAAAAAAAEKESQRAVRDFATDLKAAQAQVLAKDKALQHLQKGALADLSELKEFDGTLPAAGSQYRHIGGVRFERDLLDIADREQPISRSAAESLFTAAMDGPGVTPTEKRTLRYILKKRAVDDDARSFLTTKMGSSWYQQVDGVTYERLLLTLAEDAAKPISKETASKLWESAMDANQVTPTERKTLEYILSTKEFEEDAKAHLEQRLAGGATPALLAELEELE